MSTLGVCSRRNVLSQARMRAVLCSVMAGLVPAIHVFLVICGQDVDARAQASGSDAVLRTAMPGRDDWSLHFRQPRRVAGHQVDLEIDLAAPAPGAERGDAQRM